MDVRSLKASLLIWVTFKKKTESGMYTLDEVPVYFSTDNEKVPPDATEYLNPSDT
jgi:hypothetical protein